jgi:cell division protein FtsB
LSNGRYFQVEQAGSAVAFTTPYDEEIATLSAQLDGTRLYFGTEEEMERMRDKMEATEKLNDGSSVASLARRGAFNASSGGRLNMLGENELVAAYTEGKIDLDELEKDALPEALVSLAPKEQKAYVAELAQKRADIQRQIRDLSEDRNAYLDEKVREAGGMEDSLDSQVYEAVKEQAAKTGLEYEAGPSY